MSGRQTHEASETLNEKEYPVEVNQRALIARILARYPGEFTLFRELLQNSDDAQADTVQIYFETAAALRDPPTPSDLGIVRWTFKNNGEDFRAEDWARLSKIATGNPNSEKIGFYSVFSVTEHPVVSSGGTRMEFYFEEDQLHFRRTDLPPLEGEPSRGTTIEIPLREPGIMPEKNDFMRFLATSITFMVHLKTVNVFLDRDFIGCVNAIQGSAESVNSFMALPHSSPSGMMTVHGLQRRLLAIKAEISTDIWKATSTSKQRRASPASEALLDSDNYFATPATRSFYMMKLDLTLFTAKVHAKVDDKLSKRLLLSTYKRPSSQLDYSLVYTGKDEYDQSFPDQESKNHPSASVFQGLRADLDGASHPRIFIGRSTIQTTGIGGHMAAPFISTVEHESIDLVDRNIAIWNRELLYVGGFLARVVYELELTAIKSLWQKATADLLRDRFIHVLKFFTFYDSTPSSKVAQQIQHSFYSCSTSPLRLLSSVGVRDSTDIRLFDPLRSKFLKYVPILPPEVTEVARRIVDALPHEHKIRTMTLEDMSEDLRQHTLDETELLAYLKWQISYGSTADMTKLSKVTSFWTAEGTSIRLSTITSFIKPKGPGVHALSDGPMPPASVTVESLTDYCGLTKELAEELFELIHPPKHRPWLDERFAPDSSNCISLPILS